MFMPVITVQMYKRPTEIKARIARGITDVIVREAKVQADGVIITFVDVPSDGYAKGGDLLAPTSSTVIKDS